MKVETPTIVRAVVGLVMPAVGIFVGMCAAKLFRAGHKRIAWTVLSVFALTCLAFVTEGVLHLIAIWRKA